MTDSRLRELERRWKESGSPEDEAAYLLERVRGGALEKEKLELAAYCGHEAARLALGDEAPEMPESLEEWVCGIAAWGRVVTTRLSVDVAERALPVWESEHPHDNRPRRAIATARAGLEVKAAIGALEDASEAAWNAATEWDSPPGRVDASAGFAAFWAAEAARGDSNAAYLAVKAASAALLLAPADLVGLLRRSMLGWALDL